jgi:hypothetical protein
MSETSLSTKRAGSCHCGAVKYEVDLDLAKGASRCNCSICAKIGATGAIVKPEAFRLLAGEEQMGEYRWGMEISRRFFCRKCGIHCFARGHLDVLGGDYVSVNLNTLDDTDVGTLKIGYWDGRHNNWQAGLRETPWPIFTSPA